MTISGMTSGNLRISLALAAALMLLPVARSPGSSGIAGTSEVLVSADPLSVQCTTSFSVNELAFGELLGYDTVGFEDGGYLCEAGQPMLPAITVRIAVPAGMTVTGAELVDAATAPIAGDYNVFPGQPPRRVSDNSPLDFVAPDAAVYASATAYPSAVVEFAEQSDLAGQPIAVVRLYPVQYHPAERELNLHTDITFTLEGVPGYRCGDYLPAHVSERRYAERLREVRELVVNPDDVVLCADDNLRMETRGVEPGDYDYVIITRALWVDDFQPLADWKTKKGTPAVIVSRGWIYNNYDGDSNPEKIRAFVQDAAATWGASCFLLGGDTDTVPYHTRTISNEDIPNDTYYADYDDDWVCEVDVGRAPVRGTADIGDFIEKVLTYEQDPPLTDYAQTVLMLGFDLAEEGSNEGEGCKEEIRDVYVPSEWTTNTEYDSEAGSHRSDSIAYLNEGHHLVNHIDHCNTSVMGVGSVNHGQHLSKSDMSGLYNGERLSILYTIGCWPCDYPTDTCIGEAFVRNASGGGVAFIGNSRYGWYNPYTYSTLSLRYDRFFFRSLFLFDYYQLGACFSRHKNQALTSSDLMRFIFTELTLLGDPEVSIWTADPQTMTVTHDTIVPLGAEEFSVQVTDAAGSLAEATVCLWKDGEVYLIDTTDESGSAAFTPEPVSAGPMYVTVTRRNYKPYAGQAEAGYLLNVSVVGNGQVERVPDQATYDYGDEVWLIAVADDGWSLDHWSGDAEGSDAAVQVTITGNLDVTAHFTDVTSDCPEDLNDDGTIDLADLAELLGNYGAEGVDPEDGDLDGDGDVDLADLAQLLGAYGEDCPTR